MNGAQYSTCALLGIFAGGIATAQDAPPAAQPERVMNVRLGPETVFDRPPGEVVPLLADARATGENGRIGPEFVFWGFEQPNGQDVFLFACAQGVDIDCRRRVALICPAGGGTVLDEREDMGNVVRRRCRNFGVAAPGERHPGCDDREDKDAGLVVGVVSCN